MCIVGDGGTMLVSTHPAGGASTWHPVSLGGTDVEAIDCSSATFCLAVDDEFRPSQGDGDAGTYVTDYTSSQPAGGKSGWTVSGSPNVPAGVPDYVSSLGCAGPMLCVAGGPAAAAEASSNPGNNLSWRNGGLLEADLGSISCPATHLCIGALDSAQLATSTKPLGPHGWRSQALSRHRFVFAVSCASPTFCAAAGADKTHATAVLTSTHAGTGASSWSGFTALGAGGATLRAISCPTPRLCVAVGDKGTTAVGTQPGNK